MTRIKPLIALAVVCVAFAVFSAPRTATRAKTSPKVTKTAVSQTNRAKAKPAAPVESAYRKVPYVGAISINAANGEVIFEDHADAVAYPASVTKLMTMLLVLEDVDKGKYNLLSRATATEDVYKAVPSVVGIRPRESMTIDDLLMALMVKSANDAAIVLAVNSAGSLDAFVERMNSRAKELGMNNTKYFNPNGLPPTARTKSKGFNSSTCRDLTKLARVLVKMPQVFRYTSTKIGEVRDGQGQPLRFVNHNNVMVKDKKKVINPDGTEAVDGLKTGYIDAGGSSIILTGKYKGKRAIVVVLGSASSELRDENASRLLRDALGAIAW